MKSLITSIATVAVTIAAAPPAAASLTQSQLTEICRPQLEATVPISIAELSQGITEQRQYLDEFGADGWADASPEEHPANIIAKYEADIADQRANGINAASVREFVVGFLESVPGTNKTEIRQGINELKAAAAEIGTAEATGDSAYIPVLLCMMEGALADMEGRPQNIANPGTP